MGMCANCCGANPLRSPKLNREADTNCEAADADLKSEQEGYAHFSVIQFYFFAIVQYRYLLSAAAALAPFGCEEYLVMAMADETRFKWF